MLSRSALLLLLSAPLARALPAHKHQEAHQQERRLLHEEEESSEESRNTVQLHALDDSLDALTHAVGELALERELPTNPLDEATARANYEMYGDELGAPELERKFGTLGGQLQECFKIAGELAGCELDDTVEPLDPAVRAGRPFTLSSRRSRDVTTPSLPGRHATSLAPLTPRTTPPPRRRSRSPQTALGARRQSRRMRGHQPTSTRRGRSARRGVGRRR